MDDYQTLRSNYKRMIKRAMADAKYAHDLIFDEKKFTAALAYLNSSIAKFSAAEALCYAQYDELNCSDIDAVFHQFQVFSNEMLRNIRTDHSHQWTDIEYQRLVELFDASPLHD